MAKTPRRPFHTASDAEIRSGVVSDVYFARTVEILAARGPSPGPHLCDRGTVLIGPLQALRRVVPVQRDVEVRPAERRILL